MSSKEDICNLTIGHLGTSKQISNLDTDKSTEAKMCKRYYDISLRKVLRDFRWSFSTEFTKLNLIEHFTDPDAEWRYSYKIPSDCLRVVRILSGTRVDNAYSKVSYKIVSGTIRTDEANAEIEYQKYIDDPSLYTPDFILAFSYFLASMIAPQLTRQRDDGNAYLQKYVHFGGEAKNLNFNEEEPDLPLPDTLEASRY